MASEGLRIAEYLMATASNHEVTTYIEDDAECYSACGLIFLAGRLNERGSESYPARFLYIGGRLGFHAPYIETQKLEDRRYSRTELGESFQAAKGALGNWIGWVEGSRSPKHECFATVVRQRECLGKQWRRVWKATLRACFFI
jgi:hypothetical protein